MNIGDVFLGCFAFGLLWSIASVLLGGFHLHGHAGQAVHGAHQPVHLHVHTHHVGCGDVNRAVANTGSGWMQHFLSLHTLAIFLAWMGGSGYLLVRHTNVGIWIVITLAVIVGIGGGAVLAMILRFLHGREFAMNAADYDMIGVLGRISSPIRKGGTGEMVFTQDGGRRLAYVRSETDAPIERDQEVVVTSYRRGIAYVRTWAALTGDYQASQFHLQNPGAGAEDAPPAHH
jgi:hypothetical protein